MYQCSPKYLSSVCVKFSFFLLLLLTIVFSSNSNAQVGIGFTDDGTYTGTIGSNKGALEAYRCPAGTVLRGLYHVDKSMTADNKSTRGMTAQVGLYCASIDVDINGNVSATPTTPDGVPAVLGQAYDQLGTVRHGYCPSGSIAGQLGGYDRTSQAGYPWSSSLDLYCTPLNKILGDWIGLNKSQTSSGQLVGVNETNYPHTQRGPFCDVANSFSAVAGIHRQAGGQGYDGINVYCGQLQQARLSAIVNFNNYNWDRTLGGGGWLVNLMQNGSVLTGHSRSGTDKVPYGSASDNNTSVFNLDSELYVLPNGNYGAEISQAPNNISDNAFVQSGSCIRNDFTLSNIEDNSCELTVSGRPDLSVSIQTPNDTYDQIGQQKNVSFRAANLGPGIVQSNYGYSLDVTIPTGWTVPNSSLPNGCSINGQVLTCLVNIALAGSTEAGQEGGAIEYTVPFETTSTVSQGSFPVSLKLNREIPDNSGDLTRIDYNTENDTAQSNVDYATIATITLSKKTIGGSGTFQFSGTNGVLNHNITTTSDGATVKGPIQHPDDLSLPVVFTEVSPENWRMTEVSCTDADTGSAIPVSSDIQSFNFTISPDELLQYDDISCLVVNEFVNIQTNKNSSKSNGSSVKIGDDIEYTLTTVISGGSSIADIVLTDTMSSGLTFNEVSSHSSEFTIDTGSAPVLSFTLPAGTQPGTYEVVYTATVNSSAVTEVNNNVVTSAGTCQNCSIVNPVVIVNTNKTANLNGFPPSNPPQAVQHGDVIVYTLETTVQGGVLPEDLVLEDSLSSGLEFMIVTSAGDFAVDQSAAPIIKFTLPAGASEGVHQVIYQVKVLESATIDVSNSVTPNWGGCVVCSTVNPIVGIITNKNSSPDSGTSVEVNDLIEYTITVDISDGVTTHDLNIEDILGSGLEFAGIVNQGSFVNIVSAGSSIKATLPAGSSQGSYDLVYTASV